jgi:hypothetical protein
VQATRESDPGTRAVFRAAGIAALALALCYLAITAIYVVVGAVPSGEGEAWLTYLQGKEAPWWGIVGLSVLTDLLLLLIALALFLALRSVSWLAGAIGAGLLALFAILDLAVTWSNYASLISLSSTYAAATDPERAAAIAAAEYASSVLGSTLWAVYVILVPGLGILALSVPMLDGTFSRAAGWLGVATGVLAAVAVIGPFVWAPLGTVAILTSLLTTAWVLVVGVRLLRLGATTPPP